MLKTLLLQDAPCFGPGPTYVDPLGKVTFIFGANGTGKTTISESLRTGGGGRRADLTWAARSLPLSPRVYNRAYVDETIARGGNLPGVFVLGTGSAKAQEEIDELTRDGGAIPTAHKALVGLNAQLGDEAPRSGVIGQIAETRTALSEAAWKGRARLPEELLPTFDRLNSSKARLLEKVLTVAVQYTDSDLNETDLVEEAASAFDPDATTVPSLPESTIVDIADLEGNELLKSAIVGSGDVSLAALVEALGNDDWVAQGQGYLKHSGGLCPFCQQKAPADLARHLAEYFNDTYNQRLDRLKAFARRYRDEVAQLRATLATVDPEMVPQLPTTGYELALARLETVVEDNEKQLASKLEHPASSVRLASLTEPLEAVNDLVGAANKLIEDHNERIRNRLAARASLVERCWRHFVRGTLAADVAAYEAALKPLSAQKAGLEAKITQSTATLRDAQQQVTDLRAQLRSSEVVADAINVMLTSVGFTSFSLTPSGDDAGGYRLVREGGTPAATTLSEGERTFITFLYFVHQLRHVGEDATKDENLLVVIDDPISSLDSDILFVVSSLTRRIIQTARRPNERVKQVVVLTHNTQFHKEITYVRKGDETAGTVFFTVVKAHGGTSTVVQSLTNPVTSSYRALWGEVRRSAANRTQDAIGLENVLRRIIENYFTTVGIADDDLVASFPIDQQAACRSLFAWMNDGSHTIMDDLHYAPSGLSTQTHLQVFERVFEQVGHGSHHALMMRGELSSSSGEAEPDGAALAEESADEGADVIEFPG